MKIIEDINERLENEFDYLVKKYPNVAFNVKAWNGVPNDKAHGKKYLFTTEPYITIPNNYNPDYILQYDKYIVYNTKIYERYKNKIDTILTPAPINTHNYYRLDKFLSYDKKIKGICMLNKLYHTGREGDIVYLREKIMRELDTHKLLTKHIYGFEIPGATCYPRTPFNHSNHVGNLRIINKYLFVLCLESTYHFLWSWNFVTERLFNAFKAKTVPIYYGCYNIKQKVPEELYIDYSDFNFNNKALGEYLIKFPKDEYIEMTERAFEWVQKNRFGNVEDLEEIFGGLK